MNQRVQHFLIQGTPEWDEFRANHDGSSEAAAMLGMSPNVSRTELLKVKATGIAQEISKFVQTRVFAKGHETEEAARPMMDKIVGDDLFPSVWSFGRMSASCDGLTDDRKIAAEHKQYAEALFNSVMDGVLPEEHKPQTQQILYVTGAEKLLFMVSDGTPEKCAWMWVYPDPEFAERLVAGWALFNQERENYKPVEIAEKPKAEVVIDLPALFVHARGEITTHNMEEYGEALTLRLKEVRSIALVSDQDFSNAKKAASMFREQREKLENTKNGMLAQTTTIGEAVRMIEAWQEDLRLTALQLEKDVEREDLAKKRAMVADAKTAYQNYINELYAGTNPIKLNVQWPDFAQAIKNKRSYASMQDAVNTMLANAKIDADRIAKDVRTKLAWCKDNADGYGFLFSDLQQVIYKPMDDFTLLVKTRINDHKAEEERKLEAERERIRVEEEAKARAEAEAKLKAEQEEAARQQREREGTEARAATAAQETISKIGTGTVSWPFPTGETSSSAAASVHISPPSDNGKTMKLDDINSLFGFTATADFMKSLGFEPVRTEKAARLYRQCDVPAICDAISSHAQAIKKSFLLQEAA